MLTKLNYCPFFSITMTFRKNLKSDLWSKILPLVGYPIWGLTPGHSRRAVSFDQVEVGLWQRDRAVIVFQAQEDLNAYKT